MFDHILLNALVYTLSESKLNLGIPSKIGSIFIMKSEWLPVTYREFKCFDKSSV